MQLFERKELNPENIVVTPAGMAAGDVQRLWVSTDPEPGSAKISLLSRIFNNEISHKEVLEAFRAIKNYIVIASLSAQTRCIDGRVLLGYVENRDKMCGRELGAQVAGGTAGAALCFRLAQGPTDDTFINKAFEEDFLSYAQMVEDLGFKIGVHSDEHALPGFTGCGAVDNMPQILKNMTDAYFGTRLNELTKAIMGEMYDSNLYSQVLGNANRLQAESKAYFKNYRETIYEKIQKKAINAVSILTGRHNEAAVLVNRIYGTTFHRDEFSTDHNHNIQAINYDYWQSVNVVERYMKDGSELKDLSVKRKKIEGQKILTARVMYAVGTLMTLTDGTIEVYLLDEKDIGGQIINLVDNFGERSSSVPQAVAA